MYRRVCNHFDHINYFADMFAQIRLVEKIRPLVLVLCAFF
jgi:hypothetical protein